jgi:hypothetical protein
VVGFVVNHGQGEVAAERHELLAFGDDWFAEARPWVAPLPDEAGAGADASWVPAAWLDEPEEKS